MKKIAFLLAVAMLLGSFAGCGNTADSGETTMPPAPALTGTVSIEGEAIPDTQVTAKATLDQTDAEVIYEWRVDGKALSGFSGESCFVPVTAAGKKLSVAVKSADETKYTGSVESEEVTVGAFEGTKMTLAGLYSDMKILGRTPIDGTGINTCWPGTGFSIKVKGDGSPLKLGVNVGTNTGTTPYYCVEVDGVQVDRTMMLGSMEYTVELTAGEHTVTIYRDSANSPQASCKLEYIDFAGEILAKPEDKALYIEVIGDSIACGLGSLGTYTPGVDWVNEEHSVSNSFGWYVAQDFQADVSVIAKGGIGAVKAANDKTMVQIYPYVNGYTGQVPYDFARKPDLVLVELGANDGGATEAEYTTALTQIYQMIFDNYGADTKVLWVGRSEKFCAIAKKVALDLGMESHGMTYDYGRSGSGPSIAAAAHPDKDEHRAYADAITKYIKDNNLLG